MKNHAIKHCKDSALLAAIAATEEHAELISTAAKEILSRFMLTL